MSFAEFFHSATGNTPYGYQCRLACGDTADSTKPETLVGGVDCASRLISIPTGLGKTAAVTLAWLWNRVALGNDTWPRRLIYCLPMRTLVEQTWDEVGKWLYRLALAATEEGSTELAVVKSTIEQHLQTISDKANRDKRRIQIYAPFQKEGVERPVVGALTKELSAASKQLLWLATHSPVILMGGEENDAARREWSIHPEKPAILIGTQDMLLSRALNRGYGMSRARWPMHFALLNNDALWLLDETQLMGPGVSTAAQLEAFRNEFKTLPDRPSVTWYASATTNEAQLQTREWRGKERPTDFYFGLSDSEKNESAGKVAMRRFARKQLDLHEDWDFGQPSCVMEILTRHRAMLDALRLQNADSNVPRRTLVICNTVKRATAIFKALEASLKNELVAVSDNFIASPVLLLMHSRFRQREREQQRERLAAAITESGQIVVATQVIEAGVDISCAILWTDIAPLASLVQRLGRMNRAGEFGFGDSAPVPGEFVPQCIVVGVEDKNDAKSEKTKSVKSKKKQVTSNVDDNSNDKKRRLLYLPYTIETCQSAWQTLCSYLTTSASPAVFEEDVVAAAVAASIPQFPYSLQRHELLDFFDTDANLSLGFTDVSPFVRGLDEDTDIHVLWRTEINSDAPPTNDYLPDFQREELCAVPISQARATRNLLYKGWFWCGKDTGWVSVRETDIFPGMTIMLPAVVGGYSQTEGWTGQDDHKPDDIHEVRSTESDEDLLAFINNGWQSIPEHTAAVQAAFTYALNALPAGLLTTAEHTAIERGIDWHDVGKNLTAWQQAALDALAKAEVSQTLYNATLPLAKFSLSDSPKVSDLTGRELKRKIRELQRAFRPALAHEAASALALRQYEQQQTAASTNRSLESLLAEYLVMSHHGHVRKVLRDELPRNPEDSKDAETVRGIKHGDVVPTVFINGQQLGCASISTDCRRMGRDKEGNESYTRGVLRLLTHYGPFRLAFFEVIFRSADMFASATAQTDNKTSNN